MARATEVPTNYDIATNAGTVTAGLASALTGKINGYIGTVEDKAQLVQAHLEELSGAVCANGAISGGTLSAGVGLHVAYTSYKAIVGNVVEDTAVGTVTLTDDTTNYLWMRQNGTGFTVGTAATAPADAAGGASLLWGTVTAAGGTTTVISNKRNWAPPPLWSIGTVQLGTVTDGTVTVGGESLRYHTVVFAGTPGGTVAVEGPIMPGAHWTLYNGGTPSVAFRVTGGTGLTVATLKHAQARCDGSDYVRVTADT